MEILWSEKRETRRIASHYYDGYIYQQIGKLRPKLPRPLPDIEDMYQDFLVYCLEAVKLFDNEHTSGARFSTLLYRHLTIRSLQWFNHAWLKKNHPENKSIFSLNSAKSEDDEGSVDFPAADEHVELTTQFLELKEACSSETKEVMKLVLTKLSWGKQTNLVQAFHSKSCASLVGQELGIFPYRVRAFVDEIVKKAPKYVEV